MTLQELAVELERRWASHRKACLEYNDPEWRAIDAGQARAYADALLLVEAMLETSGAA